VCPGRPGLLQARPAGGPACAPGRQRAGGAGEREHEAAEHVIADDAGDPDHARLDRLGIIAYLIWAKLNRLWPFGRNYIHEEFLHAPRERAAVDEPEAVGP
jgi:hypothetical protein